MMMRLDLASRLVLELFRIINDSEAFAGRDDRSCFFTNGLHESAYGCLSRHGWVLYIMQPIWRGLRL